MEQQPRTNTYDYGHIQVVVHRPSLDGTERLKQEANLQRAMTAYGKAMMKREYEGGRHP